MEIRYRNSLSNVPILSWVQLTTSVIANRCSLEVSSFLYQDLFVPILYKVIGTHFKIFWCLSWIINFLQCLSVKQLILLCTVNRYCPHLSDFSYSYMYFFFNSSDKLECILRIWASHFGHSCCYCAAYCSFVTF